MKGRRNRRSKTLRIRLTLASMTILVVVMAISCVHYEPRYTPETVAPPASLEEASIESGEKGLQPLVLGAGQRAVEDKTAESATPPLSLTLDEAVRTALERNRALEVQSYAPEIVSKAIAEARAAFDPGVSIGTTYSERNTPGSNTGSGSAASYGSASTQTSGGDAQSSQDNFDKVLAAFQSLIQQTELLMQYLQADETSVNRGETFDTNVRLSQPLPTGAEAYISGAYTRGDSSLLDDPEYTGAWSIGITQALLRGFGSKVNLVSLRQARNDAAIGDLAFRDFALRLVAQVESAYWELALAQETLRIREFSLDLVKEQLKLNEALIAVGKLSGSARVSAEAEVAAQKAQLVDAQAGLQGRSIDLWQLLNPDSQAPDAFQFLAIALPEVATTDLSAEDSVKLARLFRPDLAQARLNIANGELAVIQTKNGLLPRLDAFASYGVNSSGSSAGAWREHLDDSTFDQFEVGLTFSTTLGNRAEKARYQRAKLQEGQAEAAVRNLEQSIESDVRKAVVEVLRQEEQIAASRQEVLNREEELAVETEQFRLGRSTNLDVLQVQQKLVQAKVQEATALVRRLQALAALYEAEGTLLTRRGVVVANDREHSA